MLRATGHARRAMRDGPCGPCAHGNTFCSVHAQCTDVHNYKSCKLTLGKWHSCFGLCPCYGSLISRAQEKGPEHNILGSQSH